ncbi:hypothetical protein DH2020_004242 [Rehmannia glutinosa]|uniref:Major facilitator superfamily (MFS) profile domain-containing protein n=1 Tax=Rehmannia glutinosa TaxID=99300 RepID=A0ABR0XP87_REHGL
MNGAALVAIAATIGNFLQGWDNATIAGAIVYIKKELELGAGVEGLIVAMSLIGATFITTCSGTISDWIGRRPMLITSSMFYFLSGLIMLWSPNVYVLLLARLLDGFGIGLAVTLVPLYISETAPSEIRGLLNTLPQFTGSGGMFLAYLSKGKMIEAKRVLQQLRGREDVSGEMALLVEGLAVGGDTSIEEYIIGPADELDENQEQTADKEPIKLYGPEAGLSWVAKPVTGQSRLSLVSRQGSMVNQSGVPLMDPLVTLLTQCHEKLEMGSMRSMLFPIRKHVQQRRANIKSEEWDEESLHEGYTSESHARRGRRGWKYGHWWRLAIGLEMDRTRWRRWKERRGFKRIYLHQEGGATGSRRGSLVSIAGGGDGPADGEYFQAAALVSQPALYSKELMDQRPVGPAMVHPSETAGKVSILAALLEPKKAALIVGIGIQILQQQAGVDVLLSNLGIGSNSASFLISGLTNFLCCSIAVAMRFMDVAGRRSLLLTTIPVLIISLIALVIGNVFDFGTLAHAIISTMCVVIYFCTFVMGYGPIPNILCSEIFPTRVRGICIAICALVFWICDVIVTYTLPGSEAKGMPLEVITEFFAVGAKQGAAAKVSDNEKAQ